MRKTLPLIMMGAAQLTYACSHLEVNSQALASEQPWGIISPESSKSSAQKPPPMPKPEPEIAVSLDNYRQYKAVIDQTRSMISNPTAQRLATQLGLRILDLTWEDTGRYKGSAVGPNISDMTIQVQQFNPQTQQHELNLMPVIRHPNFTDKTGDVRLDQFYLRIGNQNGQPLQRVTLKEFLGNFRRYLSQPESWQGSETSLLADRDSHVLVSAQACFLPIPQAGKAEFNPVLFNYQSSEKNPAVLTLLVTREGTSATIIDNKRDGFAAGATWGQRLFFNKNGQRASLTGSRASDFKGQPGDPDPADPNLTSAEAEAKGMNMVMLIQVPLKQKLRPRFPLMEPMTLSAPMAGAASTSKRQESDVEAAVIGHGKVEGPFTEIDGLAIARDPNFPIRVTVQFYKATSNGIVSTGDMQQIQLQIARIYADADFVGSLVTEGETSRPTEYTGSKQQPPGWWEDFWQRHEANTGQSRQETLEMLRRLRGQNWTPRSEQELQQQLDQMQSSP
ncbi:MAG: hypothetical protein KME35_09730 [Aphanocapsa sp. GSE-SYN-MK-11-07L]|jgi:hypothetical protein|nr:hypothetical protein [Aphanocapsa sp. GSE-SYN-MK-11-07L]